MIIENLTIETNLILSQYLNPLETRIELQKETISSSRPCKEFPYYCGICSQSCVFRPMIQSYISNKSSQIRDKEILRFYDKKKDNILQEIKDSRVKYGLL